MTSIFSIFKSSSNSFEGQKEGEKVLLLLHRHPFTILVHLGLLGMAGLVPIFVGAIFWSYIFIENWFSLFLFISSIWYLGLWFAIFYALTIYILNTVVVTDRRIIDSDQHGLFNRQISELHSHRIQDVSIHTHGLIETVLRFGDVTVQTAGAERQFTFHQIPDPDKVKDVIMQITATRDSGVKAVYNTSG
jgi:uncharacterized membrane protein YdbT with pleckstrin-like domain